MIAVLSDIHGNLPALLAVLEKVDELGCEHIISLGDVTGYYAQPGECIAELQHRNATQLLGNHDAYLVSGGACPRSRLVSELLQHQRRAVSAAQVEFLAGLEPKFERGDASFVHGGWRDPLDEYVYRVEAKRFPAGHRFYFSGHTHVQCVVPLGDGRTYCNPGSVGQPRDGDRRAAFALYDGKSANPYRVEYDIDATAQAMRDAGFDDERLWRNLYEGAQIGGRVDKVTVIRD